MSNLRRAAAAACVCGEEKRRGFPFCQRCWKLLPLDVRQDLYTARETFERSYRDAIAALAVVHGED